MTMYSGGWQLDLMAGTILSDNGDFIEEITFIKSNGEVKL
jgi:hypothetical protein